MEARPAEDILESDLYPRQERVLDETTDSGSIRLRLMQWNILADVL